MATIDDILRKVKGVGKSDNPQIQQPETVVETQPTPTQEPLEQPSQPTPQKDVPPAEKLPSVPEQLRSAKTNAEIVSLLRKPLEITPEEQAKEEKRERTRAIISAIGDGVASIANLYYTTKGALSSNMTPSLTEANRQRYEGVLAKREKMQQEYIAALERAGLADLAAQQKEQLQRQQQAFQAQQADKGRGFQAEQADKNRGFQSDQADKGRKFQEDQADKGRAHQSGEAAKNRGFQAGQNAANRQLQRERIAAQGDKDKSLRISAFKKQQGDEIPFVVGGKTYVVGSKALSSNVGNIVANILDDMRNSPKFKNKSDKELQRDVDWLTLNRELNTARADGKKLAETMKRYAKDSPSAIATLRQMADYYNSGKKEAEQGYSYEYSTDDDFGFTTDTDVDSLFD